MRTSRISVTLLLCFLLPFPVFSQTLIGGIINTNNEAATAVNAGNNSVTVVSAAPFAIGDTVIIIQMKGATINTANAATFGDVTAMNNAGKYELNIICDIQGNEMIMEQTMLNPYDAAGAVQVVGVPTYTEAQVNSVLDVNPWNGATGGVFAIQVKNTLRLQPGTCINLDGDGFQGGAHEVIADGCGCAVADPQFTNFFYPGPGNADAALKGEGIAELVGGMESGKGKQATGGGGGNDHNAGGGGGSNYGAGGGGGQPCVSRSCFFGEYCRGYHPGVGGAAMSGQYSNVENRIFLGGGGGAGDDNNGTGSGGGDGAGIVIIIADSVVGNAADILLRGIQAGTTGGDAGGGGGAGGTVLLDVRAYHPSAINVYVHGGNGSNSSWAPATTYNSKGKGGGGGGGMVWHQGAALPGNVTVISNGGARGAEVAPASPCVGDDGGSADGAAGATLNNLVIPFNSTVWPACGPLPVEYAYFNAEKAGDSRVTLSWETLTEANTTHFEIQRSADSENFETIGTESAVGQVSGTTYAWDDEHPMNGDNWYRLKQVDVDGKSAYTEAKLVVMDHTQVYIESVYPNPVMAEAQLMIRVGASDNQKARIKVLDVNGKTVLRERIELNAGRNEIALSTNGWAAGTYFVQLQAGSKKVVRKVIVAE